MTTYTPRELGAKMKAIIAALTAALSAGVREAITRTNRAALANLSGSRSAAPWTYPVPVRTPGGLRGNQGIQMDGRFAGYVLNAARYAAAIHNGYVSQWAGRGKHSMRMKAAPRPYLDDAVETTQPLMVIQRRIEGALATWA